MRSAAACNLSHDIVRCRFVTSIAIEHNTSHKFATLQSKILLSCTKSDSSFRCPASKAPLSISDFGSDFAVGISESISESKHPS